MPAYARDYSTALVLAQGEHDSKDVTAGMWVAIEFFVGRAVSEMLTKKMLRL